MTRSMLSVLIASLVLISTATGAGGAQEAVFSQLVFELRDGGRVRFEYDVLARPEDALFALPGPMAQHPDGRLFWLDTVDNNIKVLASDGTHLFSFGREGLGPGEWTHAGAISINASGNVYVWDEMSQRVHEFDAEGQFLRRILQEPALRTVTSIIALDSGDFLIAGLSYAPTLHGFLVHHVRPTKVDDRWHFEHVKSYVDVPELEPGLYRVLATGLMASDHAGGIVTSLQSRHSVRRFSGEEELWEIEDLSVLPDVAAGLELMDTGRVWIGPHARAVGVFVAGDWIVHQMLLPAIGLPEVNTPGIIDTASLDRSQIRVPRRVELIDIRNPNGRRLILETETGFSVRGVDREGRLYALIGDFDPTLIRGRFTVR